LALPVGDGPLPLCLGGTLGGPPAENGVKFGGSDDEDDEPPTCIWSITRAGRGGLDLGPSDRSVRIGIGIGEGEAEGEGLPSAARRRLEGRLEADLVLRMAIDGG